MRVLLYGGTFDPPHNGHLNNLRAAAARVKPDKAIIMPAGVPPHKRASATPAALRLEMCGCFAALQGDDIREVEISDWEIARAAAGFANYTVSTLEMLAGRFGNAQLYLAVGSDMLLTFDEWHRWRDILALACVVVTSRSAGDDAELRQKAKQLAAAGGRILFAQANAVPMASSKLRARLAGGEVCAAELPESVRKIIAREGLYKKPKEV